MVAKRGDTIHIEQPWAYAINRDLKLFVCDHCMLDTRLADEDSNNVKNTCLNITLCSGCNQVGYCSNECQSAAKNDLHADECPYLAQIEKVFEKGADIQQQDQLFSTLLYPRILLQTILRLERRQDSAAACSYSSVNGETGNVINSQEKQFYRPSDNKLQPVASRKFKTLESHWQELSKNSDLLIALKATAGFLEKLITSLHQPSRSSPAEAEKLTRYLQIDSLGELFGRIKINSLTIEGKDLQTLGHGMYLQTSYFDHSCRPNGYISFGERRGAARVVATRRIKRIEDVRIAYCPVLVPRAHRRELLYQQYFFVCNCEACLDDRADAVMHALKCPNCTTNEKADGGKVPLLLPSFLPGDENKTGQQQQKIVSMACQTCRQSLDETHLRFGLNVLLRAIEFSTQMRQKLSSSESTKNRLDDSNSRSLEFDIARCLHKANFYVADIAHSKAMLLYHSEQESLEAAASASALLPFVCAFYEDCSGIGGTARVGEMEYFAKLAQWLECDEHAKQHHRDVATSTASNETTTMNSLLSEQCVVELRRKIVEILQANVGSDTALFKYWAKQLHLTVAG